jgi:hypothetical protein
MRPKIWQIAVVATLTATLTIGAAGFVRALDNDWFGSVSVQIHERDGIDLSLKIPTFLARAALRLFPDQVGDYVRAELEEWGPAVCAAYEELERCPDATLVSIESDDETVQISMQRNTFIVEIANYDERVRIAVPVAIVGEVLGQLDLDTEL